MDGAVSEAYMGTVADMGPIAKPRASRAITRCHQVLTRACQMQAMMDSTEPKKMTPRRPSRALRGMVSQHPRIAQAR